MASNYLGVGKRLDVLERLIDSDTYVHPSLCDCATKSRELAHHMATCPFRRFKEVVVEMRQAFREGQP